jgi:hypothetical protein
MTKIPSHTSLLMRKKCSTPEFDVRTKVQGLCLSIHPRFVSKAISASYLCFYPKLRLKEYAIRRVSQNGTVFQSEAVRFLENRNKISSKPTVWSRVSRNPGRPTFAGA